MKEIDRFTIHSVGIDFSDGRINAYRRICICCRKIFTASPAETYDDQGNYIEYICSECKSKRGL